MISLAAFTDSAPSLAAIADELCSRVMSVAEFAYWKETPTGRVAMFRLTKALPGLPVGLVLSLPFLHERLAAGLYAK